MNDLEMVRAAAPHTAPPSAAVEHAAQLALAVAIARAAAPAGGRLVPLPRRRMRDRARHAGAGLVAAAAAAAVLLAGAASGPGGSGRPEAPAQAFLLAAAEVAAGTGERDAGDAPFWYVESTVTGAQAEAGSREVWLGRDRPGKVVVNGQTLPLDGPASFAGLSWSELVALPTETGELREVVYATDNGDGSPDEVAFEVVASLLRESPAPAELRAALLRVAATIPGVEVTTDAPDALGRAASMVRMASASGVTESRMWLADDDARVLQVETVALRTLAQPEGAASLPAGTVLHRAVVVEARPAAAMP